MVKQAVAEYAHIRETIQSIYYPNVSMGWDPNPRYEIKEGAYGLANVAPTIVKMMGFEAPACWEASMI